jgi:peptidoglycan/xylan/chitin deacetylase (PgdA/CDA1 family)
MVKENKLAKETRRLSERKQQAPDEIAETVFVPVEKNLLADLKSTLTARTAERLELQVRVRELEAKLARLTDWRDPGLTLPNEYLSTQFEVKDDRPGLEHFGHYCEGTIGAGYFIDTRLHDMFSPTEVKGWRYQIGAEPEGVPEREWQDNSDVVAVQGHALEFRLCDDTEEAIYTGEYDRSGRVHAVGVYIDHKSGHAYPCDQVKDWRYLPGAWAEAEEEEAAS